MMPVTETAPKRMVMTATPLRVVVDDEWLGANELPAIITPAELAVLITQADLETLCDALGEVRATAVFYQRLATGYREEIERLRAVIESQRDFIAGGNG